MPKNMEDLAGCYCLPKDCSHGGLEDLTVCNCLPKDFMEDLTTWYYLAKD